MNEMKHKFSLRYIMLFIYMPAVFGDDFIPFIGMIVEPILQVRKSAFCLSFDFCQFL